MQARLFLPLLLLAGCQTVPTPQIQEWPQRRAALQALAQYQFTGRLAVASGTEGFSAGLQWQQQQQRSEVRLQAPLGFNAAQIDFDDSRLRITSSDGTVLEGEPAQRGLGEALGFTPPLSSLRYWLVGSSDPAAAAAVEILDDMQRLQGLTQSGWLIEYAEYQRVGTEWMPRRLTLNREAVRVRLVINRWQLP